MKTVIIDNVEMTLEQAHRMLWNWLADNPDKDKEDFFEKFKCNIKPIDTCFACECAGRSLSNPRIANCKKCPLTWGTEKDERYKYKETYCLYIGDYFDLDYDFVPLYEKYENNNYYDEKSDIAKQIAEMEWIEK